MFKKILMGNNPKKLNLKKLFSFLKEKIVSL